MGEELFASLAAPNVALLMRILRDRPDWCDDRATTGTESCDDAIASSLERALDGITRLQGVEIESWQWGREHLAAHRHSLFDQVPLLRDLLGAFRPTVAARRSIVPLLPLR